MRGIAIFMTTHLIQPTREEFRELAKQGNLIPVSTELIADVETPISAFRKIDRGGYSFLLESAEKSDDGGRYSFVGTNPRIIFESCGKTIRITENGETREFTANGDPGDPLAELQSLMAKFRPVTPPGIELPRFIGGAVGYLSFDTVRYFEPTIGEPPPDDLEVPETLFMISDALLIFDHRLRKLRILANAFVEGDADTAYDIACEKIEALIERLAHPVLMPAINASAANRHLPSGESSSNTTREEYLQMVRDAQEYIHAGDIFQIVPSQRFETDFTGDPLELYRALRFINPSPYMFCLKFGGRFSLVGCSPEVHVRATNRDITIRPIAGTRRRGATPEEDEANATDLLADPKECAEHLMLVDLARNDVGRIAEFSSVAVSDFMIIERYSHVMHIVSNIVGKLHPDKNAYDVMRATFPAGTVSGSPKVRAMQIIYQLEKNKRNTYAGAVSYFGFDGNLDSCIVLRTALLKDGKAYVQAGGGVVADSTPEGEYQETVNKAMAMMRAIELAKTLE